MESPSSCVPLSLFSAYRKTQTTVSKGFSAPKMASSPLSNESSLLPRASTSKPIPFATSSLSQAVPSTASPSSPPSTATPRPRPSHRRLSSTSFSSPTFQGSYTTSLLTGRMSTPPSPPVPFSVSIGVLGQSPQCPKALRCPGHVEVQFGASWYEMMGPYVGTVDLDEFYSAPQTAPSPPQPSTPAATLPTSQPGYRVPPKGQLQLVIKNQLGTIVKFLLIPYDLLDMPPRSRTFFRQMWYGHSKTGEGKPVLRYAVHLHFVSEDEEADDAMTRQQQDEDPFFDVDVFGGAAGDRARSPSKPRTKKKVKAKAKKRPEKKIYLSRAIRLVFASRTPDADSETLKTVKEEPGLGAAKYSSNSGWALVKEEAKRRVNMDGDSVIYGSSFPSEREGQSISSTAFSSVLIDR
jgi:hypothetical protein